MIHIIKFIHNKNVLYRDIKPENFAFDSIHGKKLYLIDFGLSIFVDKDYINSKKTQTLIGTLRYCSLNIHNKIIYSKRDDLISIGYLLIYLFKGELPWQNVKSNNKQDKINNIKYLKEIISIKQLSSNTYNVLNYYLNYCYNLNINDTPDYTFLLKIFNNKYQNLYGNIINTHYDWNENVENKYYKL
jgi:serine/threonine protein kinase